MEPQPYVSITTVASSRPRLRHKAQLFMGVMHVMCECDVRPPAAGLLAQVAHPSSCPSPVSSADRQCSSRISPVSSRRSSAGRRRGSLCDRWRWCARSRRSRCLARGPGRRRLCSAPLHSGILHLAATTLTRVTRQYQSQQPDSIWLASPRDPFGGGMHGRPTDAFGDSP